MTGSPGDQEGDPDTVATARPPRRRVPISVLLTISILVGIVVAVYELLPERHSMLLTRGVELHGEPPGFDLERPTADELVAWSKALPGQRGGTIPWPALASGDSVVAPAQIIGAASVEILARRAAVVRYRVSGVEVTLVVARARDALPRTHRRRKNGTSAISWRNDTWTFVAAGATEKREIWGDFVGAP